jgi:SagB-type dehydrogenase family enzyme
VQTYLYVRPGRVAGLEAGIYYHQPVDHRLVRLAEASGLEERLYNPHINRPIAREAAFALFLIAQLGAIVPIYRHLGLQFATLEAGLMAQLLEMHAPGIGLGLCQIGEAEFEEVRPLFGLDDSHVLVHSLVGGIPAPEDDGPGSSAGEPLSGEEEPLEEEIEL